MDLPNPNENNDGANPSPVSRQAPKLQKLGDTITKRLALLDDQNNPIPVKTKVAFDKALEIIKKEASVSMKNASPEQRELLTRFEETLIDLRQNTDFDKNSDYVKRIQRMKGQAESIKGSDKAKKFIQKLAEVASVNAYVSKKDKPSTDFGIMDMTFKNIFDTKDIKFKEDSAVGKMLQKFGIGVPDQKKEAEAEELQGAINQQRRDISPRDQKKKRLKEKVRRENAKPKKVESSEAEQQEQPGEMYTDSKTGVSYAKVGDAWKAVTPKGEVLQPQGKLTKYKDDTVETNKKAVKEVETSARAQKIDQNTSIKATRAQNEPIVKRAAESGKMKASTLTIDNIVAKNLTVTNINGGTTQKPSVSKSTPSSGKTVAGNINKPIVGIPKEPEQGAGGGVSIDVGLGGAKGTMGKVGSTALSMMKGAAPYAGTLVAGAYGLYNASDIQEREEAGELTEDEAFEEQSGNLGMVVGMGSGAAFGAGVGAAFGGVGAIPGAIIGGAIGGIAGTQAGKTIGKYGKKAYTGIKNFLGFGSGEETEDEYVEKRTKELMSSYPEEQQKDKKVQAATKKQAILEYREKAKEKEAAKVTVKTDQKKSEKSVTRIANEDVIPGQDLSNKQLGAMDMSIKMGNTYSKEIMEQYNKQKAIKSVTPVSATPTSVAPSTNTLSNQAAAELPKMSNEAEINRAKAATPNVIVNQPATPPAPQPQSNNTIIPVRAAVRPNESAFEKHQNRVFSG